MLQGLDQKIVNIRSFVQCNGFSLQICNRFDRRILRNEDCLAARKRRLTPEVDKGRTCRLRKNGWRLAGMADINTSHVHSLHQLRTCGELNPLSFYAPFSQLFVECASHLYDVET